MDIALWSPSAAATSLNVMFPRIFIYVPIECWDFFRSIIYYYQVLIAVLAMLARPSHNFRWHRVYHVQLFSVDPTDDIVLHSVQRQTPIVNASNNLLKMNY